MTMKWIKMFGMLGLIVACFCVAHAQASDTSSQSSSSQSGLSITLSPPADPITLAAPIEIGVTVKNTSHKTIGWRAEKGYTAYKAFDFIMLTKDGYDVQRTLFHQEIQGNLPDIIEEPPRVRVGSSIVSLLDPGKSFTLMIDLKRLYEITEPGEYTLEVSRYEEESKTTIHSNKLTLKISGQASSSQPRLSITLSPPAGPITLAAPIEIVITVKNTGDKSLSWMAEFWHTEYTAFHVLLTKDGHEPETTVFHRVLRGTRRPDDPPVRSRGSKIVSLIEPGKSFELTIDLQRLYQITEPGEYILEVSREEEAGSKTTVHSNKLTIKIE